jgi:hypothetical protein
MDSFETEFDTLGLYLFQCGALPANQEAPTLVTILREVGGVFLRLQKAKDPPQWEACADPELHIDSDGGFSLANFAHPLLARSPLDPVRLGSFPPTCSVTFLPEFHVVSFCQSGSPDDPSNLDNLARGQLALAQALYPRLRPAFAFIDEQNGALDEKQVFGEVVRDLSQTQIPYLFWADFFGPNFVAKHGRDFFLKAPAGQSQELDDGGFLYVAPKKYSGWRDWTGTIDWRQPGSKGLWPYFRRRFPKIELYNVEFLLAGGAEE